MNCTNAFHIALLVLFLCLLAGTASADPATKPASGMPGPAGRHWIFERDSGVIVATLAPIRPRPLLDSELQDGQGRAVLGGEVSRRAVRLRVYWMAHASGDAQLVYTADIGLPTTFGMREQPINVFDARIIDGLVFVVFCDQHSILAMVHDLDVAGFTLLGLTNWREEKPEGTYIKSPRIIEVPELQELAPRAARLEGQPSKNNVKLLIQSQGGDWVEFRLLRDGEGYQWFRPK